MLIDGTRVPAGPRHGRRARSARGVELNIACGIVGRDATGRRPAARIELLGASVAEPWHVLGDAIRAPESIGIVVTDGDNGIEGLLDRALPECHVSTAPSTCSTTSACAFGRTASRSHTGMPWRIGCSHRSSPRPHVARASWRCRDRSPWPRTTAGTSPRSTCATWGITSRPGSLCVTLAGRGACQDARGPSTRRACSSGPCVRSTAGSIHRAIAGSSPVFARSSTSCSPDGSTTLRGERCGRMQERSRCGQDSEGQRNDPLSIH
jgi:hypothetical protein